MCGRYYVDDETAREIERMVRNLDRRMVSGETKDIYPSNQAVVLSSDNKNEITAESMKWGFPGFEDKRLLINARAEGVLEKKTFRDNILYRRCVILAKGFYEWNNKKEKFTFQRENSKDILFMAGCYTQIQNQKCFVILTTEANESVLPVHHRMPLILEREDVRNWVLNSSLIEYYLQKRPVMLYRHTDYEQMSLWG